MVYSPETGKKYTYFMNTDYCEIIRGLLCEYSRYIIAYSSILGYYSSTVVSRYAEPIVTMENRSVHPELRYTERQQVIFQSDCPTLRCTGPYKNHTHITN